MSITAFEHINPDTKIVYQPNAVALLPYLLDELGVGRALAVCGRTVAGGPQLAAVRECLGHRLVGVFDGVRAHGGLGNLRAGAEQAARCEADVLISVGGGASIDSAKCMALLLGGDRPLEDYRVHMEPSEERPRHVIETELLPHVAIPTTAGSSSEIMTWAGIRDESRGEKLLFRDRRLVPRVAVLDPQILVHTGPTLTASSGVTALARAVETIYSGRRQPIADALALHALRMLAEGLPRAIATPEDVDARGQTLVGSLLSGIAADNAMVSLVHAFGHAVGGRYALQHGIAHAILLPSVAAICLANVGDMQCQVAAALGARSDGDAARAGALSVEALERLIAALPLPHRLRDVGVAQEELPELADATMRDPMFADCPRPFGRDEVIAVLREVW